MPRLELAPVTAVADAAAPTASVSPRPTAAAAAAAAAAPITAPARGSPIAAPRSPRGTRAPSAKARASIGAAPSSAAAAPATSALSPYSPGRAGSPITSLATLHFASDADTARFLLDEGSDIEAVNCKTGYTPLHAAARAGRVDVIEVLLNYGANVAALTADVRMRTALDLAVEHKHAAAAALLERRGGARTDASLAGLSVLDGSGVASPYCDSLAPGSPGASSPYMLSPQERSLILRSVGSARARFRDPAAFASPGRGDRVAAGAPPTGPRASSPNRASSGVPPLNLGGSPRHGSPDGSAGRRGAADLKARVSAGMERSFTVISASTFHSLAMRILEAHGPVGGWAKTPTLLVDLQPA